MKSKDKDQESEENSSDSSESEEEPKKKERNAKTPRNKRRIESESSGNEEEPKKKKRKTSPNQGKSSSEGSSDSSESAKDPKQKRKLEQPFSKITTTPEMLAKVRQFKAIVGPGSTGPELSEKEHQDLVKEKYKIGRDTKEHITVFRVKDKEGLPKKEKDEHTVPGPNWTPPSSLGYVLGAISQGSSVWLATEPKNANLISGKGKNSLGPSIYARETSAALHYGWTPREPKSTEKFGKTERGPVVVLTPPSSPKAVRPETIANLMDVEKGWKGLGNGMDSVDSLRQSLAPKGNNTPRQAEKLSKMGDLKFEKKAPSIEQNEFKNKLSSSVKQKAPSIEQNEFENKLSSSVKQKAQNIVRGIDIKSVKDEDEVNISPSKTIVNPNKNVENQKGNSLR